MYKARILLFLGIWVAVMPYLGFPTNWKSVLLTLTGLGLIYFSYILYAENKEKESNIKVFDNFSENNNFDDKNI